MTQIKLDNVIVFIHDYNMRVSVFSNIVILMNDI